MAAAVTGLAPERVTVTDSDGAGGIQDPGALVSPPDGVGCTESVAGWLAGCAECTDESADWSIWTWAGVWRRGTNM